jgi:hypothetical protein
LAFLKGQISQIETLFLAVYFDINKMIWSFFSLFVNVEEIKTFSACYDKILVKFTIFYEILKFDSSSLENFLENLCFLNFAGFGIFEAVV